MTSTDPTLLDLQRDHVLLGTDKRMLPVPLTDAEWTEQAETAAALFEANAQRKAEETLRRQAWTAVHKSNEAEHARICKIVHDKAEERMVDVARYGLAESNEAVTVRIDSGEVVGRRALSSAERELVLQPPLAFPGVRPDEDGPDDLPPEAGDDLEPIPELDDDGLGE